MNLTLSPNTVHLWRVYLPDFYHQENQCITLLNEYELQRANRFRFAIHRQRFIIARAMLRKICSIYMDIKPEKVAFILGKRGKPYLSHNPLNLQFNVSHSHDKAVYAFCRQTEIGVDVERQESPFKDGVAKRFFCPEEYAELIQLPPERRIEAFYQIWVKKEAVIKALGEGLYTSLTSFIVHSHELNEEIMMSHAKIYLHSFNLDPQYFAAFASLAPFKEIQHWEWKAEGLPCILANS